MRHILCIISVCMYAFCCFADVPRNVGLNRLDGNAINNEPADPLHQELSHARTYLAPFFYYQDMVDNIEQYSEEDISNVLLAFADIQDGYHPTIQQTSTQSHLNRLFAELRREQAVNRVCLHFARGVALAGALFTFVMSYYVIS